MKGRAPYGAGHASEIAYVFNNLNARWGINEATTEDKNVAQTLNAYWANFSKTGNPNGKSLPTWPVYNTQKDEILDIDLDGKATGKSDPRKERLDVIEKAFKARDHIQTRGGI